MELYIIKGKNFPRVFEVNAVEDKKTQQDVVLEIVQIEGLVPVWLSWTGLKDLS